MHESCSYAGCCKPTRSGSSHLCQGHWFQRYRGQELRPLRVRSRKYEDGDVCSRPSCGKLPKANGLCSSHESRQYTWKSCGIVDGTWERFDELWTSQDGRCAACGKVLDIDSRFSHLDHDHNTGLARGVLCHNCNQGIGSFKDNIHAMMGAIKYLKDYYSLGDHTS